MTTKEYREKNKEKIKEYYQKNREKINKQHKLWLSSNQEKQGEYNRRWRRKKSWVERAKRSKRIEKRLNLKAEVLTHYGKGILACVICNEKRIDCLSLDHINNDGNEQRKVLKKTGCIFYDWLKKQGYPEGFQTLCMNCNIIKGIEVRRSKALLKDSLVEEGVRRY